jgi:hypothetical protein
MLNRYSTLNRKTSIFSCRYVRIFGYGYVRLCMQINLWNILPKHGRLLLVHPVYKTGSQKKSFKSAYTNTRDLQKKQ